MNKKTKGFTLLEALIVVGIISILIATVYRIAAQRQEALLAENQAKYVNQVVNSLNDYFIDISPDPTIGLAQITALVNPPTQLIAEKLIPTEMVSDANNIQTAWGTPASISAVSLDITPSDGIANAVTGYEISLTGITGKACTLLSSQTYIISQAQRITINGTEVRAPGIPEPDVSLIAVSCNDLDNVINIASDAYKKGIGSIVNSNAGGKFRDKDGKHYIAPTGTNTSTGVTTCAGGSTWNAVVSACVCSVTSKWDGNACVGINNPTVGQAGNCQIGEFWNQISKICQPTCPTNQVYDPIDNICESAPNVTKTLCIPGINTTVCETVNNQVASTYEYHAGRHIPSNIINTPLVPVYSSVATSNPHTAQVVNSMPNNVSGNCPAGSKPVLAMNANNGTGTAAAPIAQFDGKICQMCVNGSWDGDRCVAR